MNIPEETPACFPTRKSFVTWWEGANIVAIMREQERGNPIPPYCMDCPKEYREAMKTRGMCHRPKWRDNAGKRKVGQEKLDTVKKLINTGALSIKEIAALIGVSDTSIYRYMKEMRDEPRG